MRLPTISLDFPEDEVFLTTESHPRQTQADWKEPQTKSKQNTLLIKPQNSNESYSDIVKSPKENIDVDRLGVRVNNISKTKEGYIRIKMKGNSRNQELFQNAVEENLKNKAVTQIVKTKKIVFVKDLDEATDKQDIIKGLKKMNIQLTPEDIHLGKKINKFGQGHSFVKVTTSDALKLINYGSIKVGWTRCRIEETNLPTKCFKCNCFGHTSTDCKQIGRMDGKCLNCCQEGHKSNQCSNDPLCYICTENKNHAAHSRQCPAFRKAIEDTRKQKKEKNTKTKCQLEYILSPTRKNRQANPRVRSYK